MAKTAALTKLTRKDSSTLQLTFIAIFLVSSILAAWMVRIRPFVNGQPIELEQNLSIGVLAIPHKTPLRIRQHYTGVEGIDVIFRTLVAVFIAGPARIDLTVWLQQFHFLLGFAPMIGIHVIESCRACWKKSWAVKYTFPWGVLYQSVAGALALPFFQISYILASRRSSLTAQSTRSYLSTDQHMTTYAARAALPSVMLGYVAPTAIMYLYPIDDLNILMAVVAFWMITPVLLDPLMVMFKTYYRLSEEVEETPAPTGKRPDAGYLYTLYGMLAFVAGASHLFAVFSILGSSAPMNLFTKAFIPDNAAAMSNTIAGCHNIIQWDWVFVASQQVLWALYSIYELKVAGATSVNLILATSVVLLATVALGPGGSLALTWWWRETRLVALAEEVEVKKD